MKNSILVGLLTGLLIFVSHTRAVSDEEIRKMEQAMPKAPAVEPSQPRTLLVFNLSNGFKHSSIPYWEQALDIMARQTGAFKVVQSSDMAVFDAESLKAFDAICFNNTTKLTPTAAQQKAIWDFIHSGKGIVGIHAATDNFYDWPKGAMMMGGVFTGHPWTAGGTWAIKIDEPQHPLMKPFAGKGFKVNDEIYRTAPPHYSRASQRVLMSLDMSDPATQNAKGVKPEDADTGISWIKPVGKGRLFYCSLGHNHHLTWTTPVLEHYLAGIQYAMGDLKADDAPLVSAQGPEVQQLRMLAKQVSPFEWNQSRAAVAEMEKIVRECSAQPEKLKAVEAVVLEAVQSESTLAAKDFFCRTLSKIGTEASVPVLAKMLEQDETRDMARLALDGIAGPAAESVLLEALLAAEDPVAQAALVTSLGMHRSERSVAAIAKSLNTENAVIAEAALEALGVIGSKEAVAVLNNAAAKDRFSQQAQDALLRCAEALSRSGQTLQAREIYRSLIANSKVSQIRSGAMLGLAAVDSGNVAEHVITAMRSGDPAMCRAAAKALAQTKDKSLLMKAMEAAGTLPAAVQIQLVTALAENPLRLGRETAEKLAGSDKAVRLAAFDALAVLGSEQSVRLLGSAAASDKDRDERQAAQNALYTVAGNAVDQAILAGIVDDTVSEGVRLELIQAAVQRQSTGAAKVLLSAARSSNRKIASQSVRALQSIGGPEDVEAILALVIESPGANTENALAAAAMKMADADQRASALLKRYTSTSGTQSKASLLRVMGKLGDRHTIELLRREIDSNDPVLNEAAFRAMTDWPGSDFAAKMKEMSQSSTDVKEKVLAYRAYVRMLGTDAAALIEAFSLAPRPEEQKTVIGALANCGSEQALNFVQTLQNDAALKTEAQMCLLGICEKLKGSHGAKVAAVLSDLKENGSTDAVKNRAAELIK